MRVLVLGAYGLIGSAITSALLSEGHQVTGLGRAVERAANRWPQAIWIRRDLRTLTDAAAWRPLLAGIDAVINAAGVLQDGPDDDVAAVQSNAMRALFETCEQDGPRRIVQISAVGADATAPTHFMATKVQADLALAHSGLEWVILRPGLVIGSPAFGATAMLRAFASFPFFLPVASGDAPVQTVSLTEVADAAVMAVTGALPFRSVYDLVEHEPHPLREVLVALRAWLGYPPGRIVAVPRVLVPAAFGFGDMLGRLGWRSPMRSTALRHIEVSVTGDPSIWTQATGRRFSSLHETLGSLPASVQERWFARMWLLKPLVIGTLAVLWIASGLIALVRFQQSTAILSGRGLGALPSALFVLTTSLLDVALGAAILVRRTMSKAAAAMVLVTLAYLLGGSLLTPDLWLDPLGPLLKALPALVLALVALAVAEAR